MIDSPALSRIGFGVTGPHAGLGCARSTTRRLICQAVGEGVTAFDTGPAYGHGEAERRLGEALTGLPRDKVFLMTKAGIHPGRKRDFSPGAVEMSFKDSLKRLRTDHIDLLLLHGPGPEDLSPRLLRHLEAFKSRGLLRHVGVCGRGPELDIAIASGAFDAIMAPVNPALPASDLDRLRQARQSGHSIIGIEVMAGAPARLSLPRSRSDLWYLARRIKQGLTATRPATGGLPAVKSLAWALEQDLADSLVLLTTRAANLTANARLAKLESGPQAS